ncbi:hypothetical protein [Alkalibacterium kapii]|uniref:Uncharacterized protein n=1 Tax=Alkalibacterium kapii TaxID=426704 RepID=A0A511ARN5_9LACT|nr:hypothetical protein [Alkalibacterium kapii]GEK90869.1 hypothetical protein AKA01nite_04910 [Alkalibacterium kapii]
MIDKDKKERPTRIHKKDSAFDPSYDDVAAPDTKSALGYIDHEYQRNELDESKVVRKPKEQTPGNEVEASLNPDDENDEDEVNKK